MKENHVATAGRLIAKIKPVESKTESGLLLSRPKQSEMEYGVIVSVGIPLKDEPDQFKVGQTICWGNYQGLKYQHDGADYIVLNQKDVLTIVKYSDEGRSEE